MVIHNHDAFLSNVAAHLGRPRRTSGVKRPTWSVRPQDRVFAGYSKEELIAVLKKQCQAIHTDVVEVKQHELTQALTDTIKRYEGKTVIAANDKRNALYGLDQFYEQLNEEIDVHIWDAQLGKENQIIAERADIGISFSDITLAESATVTLFNDKHHGRSISLLPKSFIAIIPKSTIVPRMTQAAQQLHMSVEKGKDVPSCVSFVSGPSNSADIEMNLIVGVHGPIQATYIVAGD
ncbi:lactate utilization protein C [Virgibacillus pantothenticus]|uniref:LutC/YkgG family protein n=1 Tax=Virgibacillus pantothenticus TaxID=1473 RepID=UPI001C2354FF|nr:lactate utilization protein C [Virgibacillus pantothenticus]MBU8565259.1 lactate utilization protein C [Virgibacillus pantothenticus]MBU8599522.1 lactate utilization protein C [Virgibacillus pantothenticus]MBU8633578.1 lactate utilization protein C [Virgibacillus pantothenticus]MBU8641802.1 lactate utilization protein C [Virgibacillus pantothenticus]MBU8645457.1 lactate utilization protein C [Virgibacillus pantothenticus]